MRLSSFHFKDLRAVGRGELFLSSAGFEFDDLPVDGVARDRLDQLWMEDYIDADIRGRDAPAVLELTDKGRQALTREVA
ncbi:hypothetical protein ACQP2Y_21200 [Actinoplanes sp. CA-051413]|uniref:hypothetical protein n=1 Tax=Actinoplanes sp. CA-051413 TaxID=3239899 RepID=UPI003D993798